MAHVSPSQSEQAPRDDAIDVSVVIPTYREAENIKWLVPAVSTVLAAAGLNGEILIVDDSSGDGTVGIVDALECNYPVRLLTRTAERGLATAVLHGFAHAGGRILICMDADGSHPPEAIPALVAALTDRDCDMALGSRFVGGGSIQGGWGFMRHLNATVARLLCRPLTSARDPMSGYFAIRRERFETAAPLDPIGYKIALELIVKCRCERCDEVPIQFARRRAGKSKLGPGEIIKYVRHLLRLYRFRLFSRRQSIRASKHAVI